MSLGDSRTLVRAAILEGILVLSSLSIAIVTGLEGFRLQSTSLVEFAILSAAAMVSSTLLCARYVVQIGGLLTDGRRFEEIAARSKSVCFFGLGLYALLNGLLDLLLPRHEMDPLSYPGLLSTLAAVLVAALVLETKYRVLQRQPSRSLLDSLADNTFYLVIGLIMLTAVIGHVFAPLWWIDTATDGIFLILVVFRLETQWRTARQRAI